MSHASETVMSSSNSAASVRPRLSDSMQPRLFQAVLDNRTAAVIELTRAFEEITISPRLGE
jgi:hypothetical protein